MTAAAASPPFETVLIVLALIVIVMIRRAYRMVRGAPVSPASLFGFAAIFTLLFAFVLALTASVTPWYVLAGDVGIVVVAAVFATGYIRDHVHLERRPPGGEWFYRLHPWVPLVYIALFVVRIAASVWVLGPSALEFSVSTSVSLSLFDRLLLVLVDAAFGASTGLLVGRSVGVYLAYRRALAQVAPSLASGPG